MQGAKIQPSQLKLELSMKLSMKDERKQIIELPTKCRIHNHIYVVLILPLLMYNPT